MEPSSKRRRLAPKVPDAPAQPATSPGQPASGQPLGPEQTPQYVPVDHAGQPPASGPPPLAPAPPAERHDFEAFARHLQDAAMLIYRQTSKSPYANVTVLMLRWEEDTSVEPDLLALEKVFRERYNYHTDKWQIPTCPNPSIKLGVQMASFLEHARPDHLLIIYYAGHGYVDPDNQLYWACNTREDAAKLKWGGVRCLFEDAQSDMLLLLDTCGARDAPLAESTSLKQVIAAYSPEQSQLQPGARSFTATLTDCLARLSTMGRPYSVQRLCDDVSAQRQQDAALSRKTNGATKPDRTPVSFTLTAGKGQDLVLAPLMPNASSSQPRPSTGEADGQSPRLSREDQLIKPGSVLDLTFDEARVLVCTTFVGDASPDMAFFKQWLHNTPPLGSKIAVEGMFIGPPTMLLISMPQSIWNVVQHDKVCCFLGYISSHNMIHLYKQLVGSTPIPTVSPQEVEDGRILLEAREAAANSPSVIRRDTGNYPVLAPETPVKAETNGREPLPHGQTSGQSALPHGSPTAPAPDNVEDSAEMQEAAEQLKALSHVRHMSDENPPSLEHQHTQVGDNIDVRHPLQQDDRDTSHDSAPDDFRFAVSAKVKEVQPRKPLKPKEKSAPPKQETRCSMCSHTPFKDSSSLRKHIAAAHTRPFPCAFSFAGCTSTFGSKNEWKRHIASQHLCLQYYRCSSCPQSAAEGKGNEFNRKDLFTQHLRRMHAPFAVKKSLAKIDSRVQVEWETHLKDMQQSCLVTRRMPPSRSACPKPDCQTVFEGAGSWDEWTEHVGRHMEKGEAQRMGVDRLLAKWALEEGIIEPKGNGEYKLCSQPGVSGSRDATTNQNGNGGSSTNNHSFISDGGKEDDDPSIIVALSAPASERMDVD